MKREPIVPPADEIQFLLSLLRISFPGQPETRAAGDLERMLARKSS